jgi:hypothetical protein
VSAELSKSDMVPTVFLAAAVLDAVPTPTDIGHFAVQKWLSDHKSDLSGGTYWAIDAANYYVWDIAWYLGLYAATKYGGTTFRERVEIGAGLMGTGVVANLLWQYSLPLDASGRDPLASVGWSKALMVLGG